MRFILLIFFLLAIVKVNYADSLTVVFQGIAKGEKYRVYFKGKQIKEIRSLNGYISSSDSFKIYLGNVSEGDFLDLSIYKKSRFFNIYRDTYCPIYYEKDKKFLIILKDKRLKRRYSINPFWRNNLVRFR
jgi:hypothetical protein